jgi:hypothetical protein
MRPKGDAGDRPSRKAQLPVQSGRTKQDHATRIRGGQARRHQDPPADRRARSQDQGPGPGPGEGDRARAGLGADQRASRREASARGGARRDRGRARRGRGGRALQAAGASPRPDRGPEGSDARGPAPGLRGLRAPDPLRQGRAPHRDLGHRLRGCRRRLREAESPPEGGLSGGTERGSGGPIRFSLPPPEDSRDQSASQVGSPLPLSRGRSTHALPASV